MVNKVASTFTVDVRLRRARRVVHKQRWTDVRLQCALNCTLSPVCDSYNYRDADNTCQLNTHDTHSNVGRRGTTQFAVAATGHRSTHTTIRWPPTRPTSLSTTAGAGGAASSPSSSRGPFTPGTLRRRALSCVVRRCTV